MRGNRLKRRTRVRSERFWREFIHIVRMGETIKPRTDERGCGAKGRAQRHRIVDIAQQTAS